MEAQDIIDALTNGVGEKPYCRREDGQMKVFVADDQLFCIIASMGDNEHLEESAARAICEAGQQIKALVDALAIFQSVKSQMPAWWFEATYYRSGSDDAVSCNSEFEAALVPHKPQPPEQGEQIK